MPDNSLVGSPLSGSIKKRRAKALYTGGSCCHNIDRTVHAVQVKQQLVVGPKWKPANFRADGVDFKQCAAF